MYKPELLIFIIFILINFYLYLSTYLYTKLISIILMKKSFVIGAIILGIVAIGIAYWMISPLFIVLEADEASPVVDNNENVNEEDSNGEESNIDIIEAQIIKQGELIASAHDVAGKVLIIDGNGKKTLRFEDFDTVNGPDLRIYLSTDTGIDDFVDLGEIKATKGNVNYELSEDIDLEKYDNVLVWCRAFRVLFSYAELG